MLPATDCCGLPQPAPSSFYSPLSPPSAFCPCSIPLLYSSNGLCQRPPLGSELDSYGGISVLSPKKSASRACTLPQMTRRRTRKPRRLRSTPKSGSLGVVVGLAGVSFLLVRISEISGGRTFHFVVIPSVYLMVSTLLHCHLWSLSLVSFFAVLRLFNFR